MPPGITLPILSELAQKHVPLPTLSNPIERADLASALSLYKRVADEHERHQALKDDVSAAAEFAVTVAVEYTSRPDQGPPAWFTTTMDRFESTLKDLGKKIDGVTSDMKLQRAQMTELQTHAVDQTKLLKSLDRRTAYLYNLDQSGRADAQFLPVRFLDGQDPTEPPYLLPAITSPEVISGLSRAHRKAYLTGYYGQQTNLTDRNVDKLNKEIMKAVGIKIFYT